MNCNPPLGSPKKLLQESKEENESILTTSSSPLSPGGVEEDHEPDRHVVNPLLSPTKSTRLTMGSRVIILGTDNVEHRVPQYVGVEAEIVVVPVHPATWFKVKFDNGKIVTFRPSALRLVSDGTTVDTNYSPPPKKAKASCRPRSNSLKCEKSPLQISVPSDTGAQLLTSIHTDTWPGCKVRILSGRMNGHIANVLGSGNGWVQLESSYGELAKRANELEMVLDSSSAERSDTLAPLHSSNSSDANPPRPTALQRRRSNSEPGSPTEISNRRNEFSTKTTLRKERKETELQREYVQRYIDKQQAKIGTRPDLKYWLSRIQGSMVDKEFERNVSRDVRSNFCHSCYMEMWSGSKFCWNELCSMSPVYWKLSGAGGSPPLARYRHAAAYSSAEVSAPLRLEAAPVDESAYACEVLLSLKSDIRVPSPTANTATTATAACSSEESQAQQENAVEQVVQHDPSSERSGVTFAPSPSKPSHQSGHKRKLGDDETKSKRSDSSQTDTEDLNDDVAAAATANTNTDTDTDTSKLPALKLRIKLSPTRPPSTQGSPSSPRKLNSPRPSSTCPRPMKSFKRIRMSASPPFSASAPPSAEEFARIVSQHEREQQQQQAQQMQEAQPQLQTFAPVSMSAPHPGAAGILPSVGSSKFPQPFCPLTTTPLLTSLLNPDYPTNSQGYQQHQQQLGHRAVGR